MLSCKFGSKCRTLSCFLTTSVSWKVSVFHWHRLTWQHIAAVWTHCFHHILMKTIFYWRWMYNILQIQWTWINTGYFCFTGGESSQTPLKNVAISDFLYTVKCCLQPILNYLALLVNSALNTTHDVVSFFVKSVSLSQRHCSVVTHQENPQTPSKNQTI